MVLIETALVLYFLFQGTTKSTKKEDQIERRRARLLKHSKLYELREGSGCLIITPVSKAAPRTIAERIRHSLRKEHTPKKKECTTHSHKETSTSPPSMHWDYGYSTIIPTPCKEKCCAHLKTISCGLECRICHQHLEGGDTILQLTACGHIIHSACGLESNLSNCPVCHQKLSCQTDTAPVSRSSLRGTISRPDTKKRQ